VASRRDEQHPAIAPSLTDREEQVLRLVAAGLSNRQIAERLGLRPQTVKNHLRRIFEKLDGTAAFLSLTIGIVRNLCRAHVADQVSVT
jgi:RNA polymerase sigma factor (sigma-70 family)